MVYCFIDTVWWLCDQRERAFVTSCTCYDCYLTSNLPSKSGSEVAFIAAWLEFPTRPCVILTHSSGEEAVFFLCVCACVWVRAGSRACCRMNVLDKCLFCASVMSLFYLSTWLVRALSHLRMLVCVLYVSYTVSRSLWFLYPHSRPEPIYSVIHKPGDSKVPLALFRGFCPSPAPLCQGPLPFSGRY